jgi:hypothetical protein
MSFNEKQENWKDSDGASGEIDIVIVWAYKEPADVFAEILKEHKRKTDVYYSSEDFLKNLNKYLKTTKICFGTELEDKKKAVDIAKLVSSQGYYNLYLLTGFDQNDYMKAYLEKMGAYDYFKVLSLADFSKTIDTLLAFD